MIHFWPTSLNSCSIQTHSPAERKAALSIFPEKPHRIAFSVAGPKLEIFNLPRSILWLRKHPIPDCPSDEVYGGEWSDYPDFQ
jgi:hypothetical protein